jgi:hypothetical protein
VFTARYALSPYIKQTHFVFKGLKGLKCEPLKYESRILPTLPRCSVPSMSVWTLAGCEIMETVQWTSLPFYETDFRKHLVTPYQLQMLCGIEEDGKMIWNGWVYVNWKGLWSICSSVLKICETPVDLMNVMNKRTDVGNVYFLQSPANLKYLIRILTCSISVLILGVTARLLCAACSCNPANWFSNVTSYK